jgi:hypothetical protein
MRSMSTIEAHNLAELCASVGVLPLFVVDNSFSAFQRGKSELGEPPSLWRTSTRFSLV